MWNLRIDSGIAELVTALDANGVASLVLKGPSLNAWFGEESPRTYADGDVLVAPEHGKRAAGVLSAVGFQRAGEELGLPPWWLDHASSWLRHGDAVAIDLHWRLQGVELEPQAAWRRLWRDRVPFTVGGRPAHRLSEPAQVLYAALHATHHGAANARGMRNLEAALQAVPEPVWRQALDLAMELRALEGFATGLRLTDSGRALAERIGAPDARSVKTELYAATPPPVALGFEQLASAPAPRRLAILARKLVPPPAFVRHWWPPAARNRRMLVVGYLYRPLWLVEHTPAGYRAWRAARRRASSSS